MSATIQAGVYSTIPDHSLPWAMGGAYHVCYDSSVMPMALRATRKAHHFAYLHFFTAFSLTPVLLLRLMRILSGFLNVTTFSLPCTGQTFNKPMKRVRYTAWLEIGPRISVGGTVGGGESKTPTDRP